MALKNKYSNFKDFLKNYNYSFSIPYYQRKYVWSKPENEFVLKKFIQDITDQFDDDKKNGHSSEYFIGNFALYTRNNSFLIDGQQRISTLVMFLAELQKQTKTPIQFYSNGHFLINGGSELGEEIEYFLFGKISASGLIMNPNSSIALAQRILSDFVRKLLINTSVQYLKDLEQFILSNITLSYIEFGNEKEALKYFLNINSLSIKLTEMEIFSAFVSQVIESIQSTKITVQRINAQLDTINKRLGTKVNDEDLVFVFLNAYFKDDYNIGKLRDKKLEIGIGKWLTGYKMDLLSNPSEATKFIDALANYIADIEYISNYVIGISATTTSYKFIWFISIFNKYTKNVYLIDLLIQLFKNRHNYKTDNIYKKGSNVIDEVKLDSYCKVAAAVIIIDYFKGRIKDLSRNDDKVNIKLSENTVNNKKANNILKDISYQNMWSLKYPVDRQDSKYTISNDYDSVFFILALQEAYLNSIANPLYNGKMINIFAELLDPNQNYQVEHLITKEDYTREARRLLWQKAGKFQTAAEYDEFRARFENLSLLDGQTNASASSDTVAMKFLKYKNARTIMNTNEPEYLVQSLVDGSDFYNNEKLQQLGSRKITVNQDGTTWEHDVNNKKFIEGLTKAAVNELFK